MDGLYRAVQFHGDAQFFEGHVGCLGEQFAHLVAMAFEDDWFASSSVVPCCYIANVPSLLDELFYHPERYSKAFGDLLPRALSFIVAGEDSFS